MSRSAPWMWHCGYLFTQPWWRPYSVACTVAIHGRSARRATCSAAPATSQSWECTSSKRSSSSSSLPARAMCSFIDATQRMNALTSRGKGGWLTRCTITPWRSSRAARCSEPRVRTCTSTPSPTRFSDSLRTWRASPPSITGGYSQENVRVRIGGGDDSTGDLQTRGPSGRSRCEGGRGDPRRGGSPSPRTPTSSPQRHVPDSEQDEVVRVLPVPWAPALRNCPRWTEPLHPADVTQTKRDDGTYFA